MGKRERKSGKEGVREREREGEREGERVGKRELERESERRRVDVYHPKRYVWVEVSFLSTEVGECYCHGY